jgi:hypothetical protein
MRQGARFRHGFGLALLGMAAVAPPAAQAATTPRPATAQIMADSLSCPLSPDGEVMVCAPGTTAAAILYLHAYAGCLVRNHHRAAREAVNAYVGQRSRDELRALVVDDRMCKPDGVTRVSAVLLAGALAEQLPGWRRRLHDGFAEGQHPTDLVQCLVDSDRQAALGMLRASPLSPLESAAAARLVAQLPACVPAGMRFETNRAALRSVLALSLFDADTPDSDGLSGRDLVPVALSRPLAEPTVTARFSPVIAMNKPRAPLPFAPRLPSYHNSPGPTPEQQGNMWPTFPEDTLARQMAWPIDQDTGEPPDPKADPTADGGPR